MKSSKIIYEVLQESLHNGDNLTDNLFFENEKEALEYAKGLVERTKELYKTDYKVSYDFEEDNKNIFNSHTIYIAEFVDSDNEYPEHTETISVNKQYVF